MSVAQPLDFTQDPESRSPDPRSPLPLTPTEARLRQAEVDAAYLAVEAARADPIYQAELQPRATEARERDTALLLSVSRAGAGGKRRGLRVWSVGTPVAKGELYRWLKLEWPTEEAMDGVMVNFGG